MLSYETGFCGCSDCNNICSSDLSVFVNSIEAASQGEKINRLMVHLRIVTLSKGNHVVTFLLRPRSIFDEALQVDLEQ